MSGTVHADVLNVRNISSNLTSKCHKCDVKGISPSITKFEFENCPLSFKEDSKKLFGRHQSYKTVNSRSKVYMSYIHPQNQC